jgi:hypothetical protein
MKQQLVGLVFGGLLALSVPVAVVSAETSNQESTTNSSTTTQTKQEAEKALSPEELKARIQEKKTRLKTKLSNAEVQKLTLKCEPSQVKINTFLQGRYKNDTPYQAKYEAFIKRLEKLSATLKQNNVDTAELDAQIVVLKQKYNAVQVAVANFRTSIADTKAINCKTDPTGFKASLEDARAKAVVVKQANQELESYVKTTIKVTLEKIRATRS